MLDFLRALNERKISSLDAQPISGGDILLRSNSNPDAR
jgi:hypothetical protein